MQVMEEGFLTSTSRGLSVSEAPESIDEMASVVAESKLVGSVQFVLFFIQRVKSSEVTDEEQMAWCSSKIKPKMA